VEIAMRKLSLTIALFAVLALQGCGLFELDDHYGNSYGGFFDYGSQYRWQLATCQDEMTAHPVPEAQRQRYMQCCMWRHGVPIDDSTGCEAPPYSG
jgi:hypothetical protein